MNSSFNESTIDLTLSTTDLKTSFSDDGKASSLIKKKLA
ncbi:unnamed protein product, partial [Rotaria magnacalcarata]